MFKVWLERIKGTPEGAKAGLVMLGMHPRSGVSTRSRLSESILPCASLMRD